MQHAKSGDLNNAYAGAIIPYQHMRRRAEFPPERHKPALVLCSSCTYSTRTHCVQEPPEEALFILEPELS